MTNAHSRLTTLLVLTTILCSTLGASAADNQLANSLSEAERKAGWQLLFDGKTTRGWRNYRGDGVNDGWKVIDGELTRTAEGAGDLISDKQYDSFEISLEYKISEGGNSGLMYHVTEDESRPAFSGPEIQIQDNVKGRDNQKAGWLYQLYSSEIDATRPAGQWNQIHVRIAPNLCQQHMNGVRYARYVKGSDDWNRRVAQSKFAKYPSFGKAERGHICLQDHRDEVAFRNIKIRELKSDGSVNDPIDGTLPFKAALAFPKLEWADWSPEDERGRLQSFRPIVLTHAGDGTDRVFVATQRGVIHVFPNDQNAEKSKVFLDLSDKVSYSDKQNEEGFLGLAFHCDYKKNGKFAVYYTITDSPHTSVVSQFRVSADDSNKADPESEEEVLRIPQPFWNHNGGTVAFGPDGYLYVALGDGGSGNDPYENAQDLSVLLGSILRIDVDRKQDGKNYAIPADNPFANRTEARGEIWAYGLRNVWRLAFDRQTETLWAADVGQNLWEEINLITKGGNYGWNLREAAHTFGAKGTGSRDDLIEPIWEYDHEVGKSITGGTVYRGSRLPELVGAYLYADYVSGKIFALRYDERRKQVVSNHLIPSDKMPVISFGEDEQGDVYFTVVTANGRGIYRFEKTGR